MALMGSNLELIPIYLDAKDRDELIRLEYLNNQINGQKYNYNAPVQIKDGSYEVWFFADIKEWKDPSKLTKDEINIMRKFGE